MSRAARNWKAGDTLLIRGYESAPGKGLTYAGGKVKAAEDGFAGGWDVFDATNEAGEEMSFYGFSVLQRRGGAA